MFAEYEVQNEIKYSTASISQAMQHSTLYFPMFKCSGNNLAAW